jgi:hypothetical protein
MSDLMHVFLSRPTVIGNEFEAACGAFHDFMAGQGFVLRRLGRSDYSRKAPLQAVIDIIDNCCGAIVLGYPQLEFHQEVRRGSQVQNSVGYVFPTPLESDRRGTGIPLPGTVARRGPLGDHGRCFRSWSYR